MSDVEDEDGDFGYDSVDYESHPSLSLALEEARNRYSDEEDRRRTVETKIGILVSIDAIIISVVSSLNGLGPITKTLSIFLAISSAAIGLYILWPRDYYRPGEEIGEIFGDAQREKHEFEKQYLNDYTGSVASNIEENDERYRFFKYCTVLTFSSMAVILLSQIPISWICGA